jgi:ribosomal protein L11 methyltransferase
MHNTEQAQPEDSQLWLIEIILPASATDAFMEGLEEFADSMSCFEFESDEIWKLQIYTQTFPDEDELKNCIELLAAAENIALPAYVISEVEQVDWVTESQKNFTPVEAGKFFIYPSWRRGEVPEGSIGIEIDPQRAFGTGGHETTKGCILAMQKLANTKSIATSKPYSKIKFLDMGCGSGILAITMAKIWPDASIKAVDNDIISVETSIVNAGINNVSEHLEIEQSNGYNSEFVQKNAPYDLIASNILAQPLIEFAPQAAAALAKDGYLILAGLLVKQVDEVLTAHTKQGLKLADRNDIGDWSILVLGK